MVASGMDALCIIKSRNQTVITGKIKSEKIETETTQSAKNWNPKAGKSYEYGSII